MGNLGKYIPSAIVIIIGIGFDVSGIQSPELAITLWAIAALLLVFPLWPHIKKMRFQSPIYLNKTELETSIGGSVGTPKIIQEPPTLDQQRLDQQRKMSGGRIDKIPVQLECNPDSESFYNQEIRPDREVLLLTETYKEYYCNVFNNSDGSLKNVSCEVEKIISIPNRPGNIHASPENVHQKLIYDMDGNPARVDLSPRGRERLWLFSRLKKTPDNEPIRIVRGTRSFQDHGQQKEVVLRVTCDKYSPKIFRTIVWVNNGDLNMTGLRPES